MKEAVQNTVTYEKYSDYRKSETVWLGEIPSHWEELPNKHIFTLKKSQVGSYSDKYDLLSLTLKGLIRRDMENPEGKFPESFDTYQPVAIGDFVFCLFDVEETPRTVGLSTFEGMITGAYTVMVPKIEINKKYLYYFYLNLDIKKRMRPLYTGLRNTISKDNFFAFKPFVPPKEEQTAIANFLDRKTKEIDQVIESRRKVLENIYELICIHVLLGKKPENDQSYIKVWNDIFPAEWKMDKAKHIFDESNIRDNSDKKLLAVTQDEGIIFKSESSRNYVSPSGDTSGLKLVSKDDFVISLRSFEGGIETSQIEGIVSPAYNVFHLKRELKSIELQKYYQYLFKTPQFVKLLNTLVTSIRDGKNISYNDFSELMLPKPEPEQVRFLLNYFEVYEKAKNHFENAEKYLNEYKNSLINNVVTGKIKVV